ncbi:MAG TPA: hypothetical protein VNI78_01705, partial [Vicinamibacterales bacterium]|nr:hypothetical protein [Vicinamibacterales bacterium]
ERAGEPPAGARAGRAEIPPVQPAAPAEAAAPLGQAVARSEPVLDDYFDRLDAAFANLGAPPAAADAIDSSAFDHLSTAPADILTLDRVLGAASTGLAEPASAPRLDEPVLTGAASGARNPIVEMFTALLAAERGEPVPAFDWPPRPAVTEELVDEITRRVLERLAPDAVRGAVAQVVADVAERLVREEIERIRKPR